MIDILDVMDGVRKLAANNPDFIYDTDGTTVHGSKMCFYTGTMQNPVDISQGCIFGQVLVDLGVPAETLVKYNPTLFRDMSGYGDGGWDYESGSAISIVLRDLGVEMDDHQSAWVGEVQSLQDSGVPWGEAVTLVEDSDDYDY